MKHSAYIAAYAVVVGQAVLAVQAASNTFKQVSDSFDVIQGITDTTIDLLTTPYSISGEVEYATAIIRLIDLGFNLTEINANKPEEAAKLSHNEQTKICSVFQSSYFRTQYRLTDAMTKDVIQGAKGSYAGYYASALNKLQPLLQEFEDWVIQLTPKCGDDSQKTRGRLQTFRDGAIKFLRSVPNYVAGAERLFPDFDKPKPF